MDIVSSEWKYEVIIHNEEWQNAESWCDEVFGDFGERWYKLGVDAAQWYLEEDFKTVWYFKTEADAVLFKLKWT